ncbi:MAG: aldose epimerase family protein [Bacteroidota bacterium]
MPRIEEQPWGDSQYGRVKLYSLYNDQGNYVRISDWGATVQAICLQSASGAWLDVVLGYDNLAPYLDNPVSMGAVIGRYANRIGQARFELDGRTYPLPANHGDHQLHGGPEGFHLRRWSAESAVEDGQAVLRLQLSSPDGDQGFPGQLQVHCTYRWDNENRLQIDYAATTDAPTHLNLTNHSYFNLAGSGSSIYEHLLQLHADAYTPTDAGQIPTGEIRAVGGTVFDLRQPQPLGPLLNDPALAATNGFDHNWVLNGPSGELRKIAELHAPTSGLRMGCWTTEPGCQVFTTNFSGVGPSLKGGLPQVQHSAVCLETQHFPDSPNQAHFPSTVLRPGEIYRSTTIYGFRGVE